MTEEIRFDERGLVPAIVQDAATGAVLMLAYMDREALDATLRTREVHFHSRSRDKLWKKGETSGNVLHLVELVPDCDADALLVGRRTFEDLRGYWPRQSDDPTGITTYLNRVQKYVVSSTMTDPGWQNSTVPSGCRRRASIQATSQVCPSGSAKTPE